MRPEAAGLAIFVAAALAEIGGCYAFWMVLRSGRPAIWLVPGIASLVVFAWLLTNVQADTAGRAFAAYGGLYIVMAIVWLRAVEGGSLTRWDLAGGALCLAGASVILAGARVR